MAEALVLLEDSRAARSRGGIRPLGTPRARGSRPLERARRRAPHLTIRCPARLKIAFRAVLAKLSHERVLSLALRARGGRAEREQRRTKPAAPLI